MWHILLCCLVAQSCLTLLQPLKLQLIWLICPRDFPGNSTGVGPLPSPGYFPDPGIEPVFPALAGGFFTTEPSGKPWWHILESYKEKYLYFWTPMSRTVSRFYIFVQWNLMLNLIGTHRWSKDFACLCLSPTISDGLGDSACMMSVRFKIRVFTPSLSVFKHQNLGFQ